MSKETFSRNKPDQQPPPPPPDDFVSVEIINVAASLDSYEVVFSGQPDSRFYALIYVTMWMGTGIMSPKASAFKLLCAMQIPTTPFTIDIATAYEARFGSPAVGNKIFTRVLLIDSISGARYNKGTIQARVSGT